MMPDWMYHWSPFRNQASILKRGLLTGKLTVQGTGFRPPFIALATNVNTAWELSGAAFGEPGERWDLWQVDERELLEGMPAEILPYDSCTCGSNEGRIKEVRVYSNIPKRAITLVAGRQR